ncbi:MAG: hypothetical protein ACFFC6_05500 [Promethearchaeota archaeon]
MKSKKTPVLLGFLLFTIFFSFISFSKASASESTLTDDTPVYTAGNTNGEAWYSMSVQPGNYCVFGVRSATAAVEDLDLFADAGYTQLLADTQITRDVDEIEWQEVGFLTVDGTAFSDATDYYVYIDTYGQEYYYAEMESGEGTGMTDMTVGQTIEADFTNNEILDAYQVYLEETRSYTITLDVPTGKTFDLFLCYGISDEDSALAYSHNDALSADEVITRSVPVSGYYCIIVTNPSYTSDDYNLTVEVLADDTPSYIHTYQNEGETTHAMMVQPGKYAVFGARSGTNRIEDLDLYSDLGLTDLLIDTITQYVSDGVEWDEIGFVTVDGTAFSSETPYYIYMDTYGPEYYYVEMENGQGTGMTDITVDQTVNANFTSNEVFDAYQIYLAENQSYIISLDVPSGKTFDLFLCQGISDEDSALAYSYNNALGADESIIRSVPTSGYYCIIITNPDWTSGDYSFTVETLEDDETIMSQTYQNEGETTHAMIVQPNKYAVFGMRASDDSIEDLDLYSDLGLTELLIDTQISHKTDTIEWIEVGFVTIDGTGFSSETPYYIYVDTYGSKTYHAEMETGQSTGMTNLAVGTPVDESIVSAEVFDAFQVQLTNGEKYNISLTVPSGVTFDLFLCYGINDEDSAIESSHSDDLSANEKIIEFEPTTTGYYCIIVTNPEETQSGTYTLVVEQYGGVTPPETTPTTAKTPPAETTPEATSSETQPKQESSPSIGIITVIATLLVLPIFKRKQK